MFQKTISLILSVSLILTQPVFAQGAAELNIGKYLSQMPAVKTDSFRPAHLRYISYDIKSNDFKLLLDQGDAKLSSSPNSLTPKLQDATQELFNYFLIGLSLPNEKFWVNLRPDAPEQIIDPLLEKTDMGKIMLEADLQLKKDTAGLTSPQNPEGKAYWDKLYKKAGELFGTENITIPTITRPWIVPGEVIIRESEDSAYIYKANLKVMLEEDYLNNQKTEKPKNLKTDDYDFSDPRMKELNKYSTELIKELILPKLTQEINTSKKYAQLRQVFFSLILSRWFKDKYKGKPGQYSSLIDSRNLDKLNSKERWSKEHYFNEYKKSFQQGEYNLKEQVSTPTGQVIRSYVSGGANMTGRFIEGSFKTAASPILTNMQKYVFVGLAISVVIYAAFVDRLTYNRYLSDSRKIEEIQNSRNAIRLAEGYIVNEVIKMRKDFLYSLIKVVKESPEEGIELERLMLIADERWVWNLRRVFPILNIEQRNKLFKALNNTIKSLIKGPYEDDEKIGSFLKQLQELLKKEFAGSSPLAPQEGASSAIVLEDEFKKVKDYAFNKFKSLEESLMLPKKGTTFERMMAARPNLRLKGGPFTGNISQSKNFPGLMMSIESALQSAPNLFPGQVNLKQLGEIRQDLVNVIKPIGIQLQFDLFEYINEYVLNNPAAASKLNRILQRPELNERMFDGLPPLKKNEVIRAATEDVIKAMDQQKASDFSERADAWQVLSDFMESSSALTQDLSQNIDLPLMPGGIDFTRINYLTRPMGSFQGLDLRLPLLSKAELEEININKELASMEQMVNARIEVSTDRLKRLLAAMSQKDAFTSQRETQLLPLFLRLCWLKEEKGSETTPDFRAVLLIADTGLFVDQGNTRYSLN